MKKIFCFVFLLILIAISCTTVHASNEFYEAEELSINMWFNKQKQGDQAIWYMPAKFIRNSYDNTASYCLEPFGTFSNNSNYEFVDVPNNLTHEQAHKIAEIAHFGYGYPGHNEDKWYAITQLMIWEISNPNDTFYLSTASEGKQRVDAFQDERQEILNQINNYETLPSFVEKTYQFVEGEELVFNDTNNVLDDFEVTTENATIKNNILTVDKYVPNVNTTIHLTKTINVYNKPYIFYQTTNGQNLIELGDLETLGTQILVNVKKTSVTLTKVDLETNTSKSQGEATLIGAKYGIYNQNNEQIKEVIFDENLTYTIENLKYGKYYIKELEAPKGYKLNNEIYEFELSENNTTTSIVLKDEVIKKKIIINKKYGENDNLLNEPNILFNIYDNKNNLITSITTNIDGIAMIDLPYGKYKITQVNTTEGYDKIDDYYIEVNDEIDKTLNLIDYKTQVPDTSAKKISLFEYILYILNILLNI